MKKLFVVLLIAFFVLALPITCYAENLNTEPSVASPDAATIESTENPDPFASNGAMKPVTLTKKENKQESVKNSPATLVSVTKTMLVGFMTTFAIFAITLVAAIPLGLIITFGSSSKIKLISLLVRGFVWVIRGTPLLLQILILVYGPGLVFGVELYENSIGVMIAFIINYACYFSEIYRGGIESIPKGQYEAGFVLGMTKTQVFFKVVLLQVVKRIIPPMGNEIITLVKDTSLVRIVGALTFLGSQYKEVLGVSFEYVGVKALIWPLFYSGLFYLVFCGALTLLFGYLEKKLSYFKS